MRARHRHLNPKSCGAVIAFDSRYMAYANNALIDSWTERASFQAYTGTGTQRPTFKERISGGSPMVLSASPNRLFGSATTNYITGTNAATSSVIFVGSGSTAPQLAMSIRSTTASREYLVYFEAGISYWGHRGGTNGRRWSRLAAGVIGIESLANNQGRVNGANVTTSTHTHGGSGNGNVVCGATETKYLIGYLGQALFFNIALSVSALKKLTHAAAYSFKITCS